MLSLLIVLAESSAMTVSKDELIEKIWDGRIVSGSAVAVWIKDTCKVIGDDGESRRLIRTIPGKGFRFCGNLADADASVLFSGSYASTPQSIRRRDLSPRATVARPLLCCPSSFRGKRLAFL